MVVLVGVVVVFIILVVVLSMQFAEAIFSPGCHLVSIGLSISSKFTVVAVHSKPVQ